MVLTDSLSAFALATNSTGSSSGMALPPQFILLGVVAIVVMTLAYFFLKKGSGGSD